VVFDPAHHSAPITADERNPAYRADAANLKSSPAPKCAQTLRRSR
jgi:hypothetical protein